MALHMCSLLQFPHFGCRPIFLIGMTFSTFHTKWLLSVVLYHVFESFTYEKVA